MSPTRDTKEITPDDLRSIGEEYSEDTATSPGVSDLKDLRELVRAEDGWTLTVLRGATPGLVLPIGFTACVLGRGLDADHHVDDAKVSREHAAFYSKGGNLYVKDLSSRNGTYVEGTRIEGEQELNDGELVQVGRSVLRAHRRSLAEVATARALQEASLRDALTGLYNRRYLDEQLGAEVAYAVRHRVSLSVMVLDIDHFKEINDTLGHAAGDHALQEFARFLSSCLRTEDAAMRYGGDEFVVLLRNIGVHGAEVLAQRIRADVEALEVTWEGKPVPLTTSIGVATCDPTRPYTSAESILSAADRGLYRAKRAGRNLVICDASPRSAPPLAT